MKQKPSREGPLSVPLPFDEAIKRALQVKPPPEGWSEYEAKLRRKRQQARQRKKAKS